MWKRLGQVTALLIGLLLGTVAVGAVRASAASTNPYSCRSTVKGVQYEFRGVISDACAGRIDNGHFGAEAITNVIDEHSVTTAGRVSECRVQLNRVVRGKAYPVRGQSVTDMSWDGYGCDAMYDGCPKAGWYNVTTSYVHDGRWAVTVQSPVKYFRGCK
jgi:hypothetical protein